METTSAFLVDWLDDSTNSGPFYARRLQEEWQIRDYAMNYEGLSRGGHVDLEFLLKSYVMGFYSGPKLVGVIAFSCSEFQQIRLLSVIPSAVRPNALMSSGIDEADFVETGCFWIDPSLQLRHRLVFMMQIIQKAEYLAKEWHKKWLLAGSYQPKLIRFQKAIFRRMLYMGADANGHWVELYTASTSAFRFRAMMAILNRITSKWQGV